MKSRLTSFVAGAGALVVAGAVLVGSVGTAAAATPPYEPDPGNELGTVSFYDANGTPVTHGNVTDAPFAAYAVASTPGTSDIKASLYGYLPKDGQAPLAFSGEQMAGPTAYPVTSANAPAVVKNSPNPVVAVTSNDYTIANLAADYPNDAPAGSAYNGLYQARVKTTKNGAKYWAADIKITGNTWQQVYPTPPTVTATTTSLSVSPPSPAAYGANVTLTATVSPSSAAGTVQFKDGTTSLGSPVAVSGGTATFSSTTFAPGSHSFSATFTATDTSAFTGSSSAPQSYTVNPRSTTTTLGVSPPSPAAKGSTETLTATVSPSDAAGSVTFKDGSTKVGSATVSSGSASTTTTLAPGTHSLTATFAPSDTTQFAGSSSAAQTYTVNKGTTSTSLDASPSSPQHPGTAVTFTATVTPSLAGTVQFKDGTTNLGSPVAVNTSTGKASFTTSSLGVGDHSITAAFSPTDSANYSGSTSPALSYTISQATLTSTSLSVSPPSSAEKGQTVTLTATVSPKAAAGTVQFKDGSTSLGTPVATDGNGQAQYSTSSLAVGSHSFVAVFTPTDTQTYSGSQSPVQSYTVNGTATSTTLDASPASPQRGGTAVTFTATVTPHTGGTVQFKRNGANLGTPVTVNATDGTASYTTSTLPSGTSHISAVFSPSDANFTGSTSNTVDYTILPATPTTTSLSVAPPTSAPHGATVTMTATVSPSAAVGSVSFRDGTTTLGSAPVSGGTATLSTSSLANGNHSFTAQFAPTNSADYTPSTSAPVSYRVFAKPTTTSLTASPASPQPYGTPVTFTATVTSGVAGKVQFKDGSTNSGSPVTVSGDKASLTTDKLAAGLHSITAVFSPTDSAANAGSTSNAVQYGITGGPTSTTMTVSPSTNVTTASTVTLRAAVSPSVASGGVDFYDGTKKLGTGTVRNGVATYSTKFAAGSHPLTAKFTPGSQYYATSVSAPKSLTVTAPPKASGNGSGSGSGGSGSGSTGGSSGSVPPGSGGSTLSGSGSTSGGSGSSSTTGGSGAATAGRGRLPFTGAEIASMTLFGVGLLLAGGLALLAGRRRRPGRHRLGD